MFHCKNEHRFVYNCFPCSWWVSSSLDTSFDTAESSWQANFPTTRSQWKHPNLKGPKSKLAFPQKSWRDSKSWLAFLLVCSLKIHRNKEENGRVRLVLSCYDSRNPTGHFLHLCLLLPAFDSLPHASLSDIHPSNHPSIHVVFHLLSLSACLLSACSLSGRNLSERLSTSQTLPWAQITWQGWNTHSHSHTHTHTHTHTDTWSFNNWAFVPSNWGCW